MIQLFVNRSVKPIARFDASIATSFAQRFLKDSSDAQRCEWKSKFHFSLWIIGLEASIRCNVSLSFKDSSRIRVMGLIRWFASGGAMFSPARESFARTPLLEDSLRIRVMGLTQLWYNRRDNFSQRSYKPLRLLDFLPCRSGISLVIFHHR